jgi:type I restriction enzyme M protein
VQQQSEFTTLRRKFDEVSLSLDRATFGVWVAIVQRLSATFRRQLNNDQPDAVSKLLMLFGDPPTNTLKSLLSSDIGDLLSRVNSLRNDWLGHAGATTDGQARGQLKQLLRYSQRPRS